MKRIKSHNNSAFTLMEVMIVVAIIGIVVSLAVPNVIAWLPKYRLKNATRDMVSFMRSVKIEAVKTNTSQEIIFDNSISPGFYYLDSDRNGAYDLGERRVNFADYNSGVGFGSGNATNQWGTGTTPTITNPITFNTNLLRFSSRGMSNTGGTIFIDNKNKDICYSITVLTTGSINIREWTGSSWVY